MDLDLKENGYISDNYDRRFMVIMGDKRTKLGMIEPYAIPD